MPTKGLAYWVHQSEVFVSADHDGCGLASIRVEFHGELARIPSLKNSKLPGRNFVNPDVLQRLKAMETLYHHGAEIYKKKGLAFGDREVVGVLVCPKRKVRFDLDNCAASIKDWCEPPTKRMRGWGVGLVNDDSRLNVLAVRAEHVGLEINYSLLVLRRWSDVSRSFRQWFSAFTN
jgi:hypothetical protein